MASPKELVNPKEFRVGDKVKIGVSEAKITKLRKYKLEIEIYKSFYKHFLGKRYEVEPKQISKI